MKMVGLRKWTTKYLATRKPLRKKGFMWEKEVNEENA